MNVVHVLQRSQLFMELDKRLLRHLASIAAEKRFAAGEIIFSEGDPAPGFHVIASGAVKIYKISAAGKEQILQFFRAGMPFGEVASLTDKPYPAFAEAIEYTETIFIPRLAFRELIRSEPLLAMKMIAVLTQRLHHFTRLVDDLSLKEVPARVAGYLMALSREQKGDSCRLDVSKAQMAARLGTIPETLSRALSKMKKAGLIHIDGSTIVIRDNERLENLAWSGHIEAVRDNTT